MGKHLSYAGRLKLIRSILFRMEQFWLSIFPLLDNVINQITCICRNFLWIDSTARSMFICSNFLWTDSTARSMFALVAWKHICLPKAEGDLDLYDIKARNNCFLAKQLWNIHLKSDSIWIRWVHHFYLQDTTIWIVPL